MCAGYTSAHSLLTSLLRFSQAEINMSARAAVSAKDLTEEDWFQGHTQLLHYWMEGSVICELLARVLPWIFVIGPL